MTERSEFRHIRRGRVLVVATPEFDIKAGLALNGNATPVLQEMESLGGRCEVRSIDINGHLLLLTTQGLTHYTLEDPYLTGNESDALYLARHSSSELEVLVQYLPPNSRTSHHWHDKEVYFPVSQGFYIWKNQNEVVPLIHKIEVLPGESHIGFTGEEPSLALIIATGSINHNPLPRPPLKYLQDQARFQGVA